MWRIWLLFDPRRILVALGVFLFVLAGYLNLRIDGQPAQRLGPDDSVVVPAGLRHALTDVSADLEMLEVTLPAAFATVRHADAALAA